MEIESPKAYYEKVAQLKDVWNLPPDSNSYFQQMIRYDRILKAIPKGIGSVVDLGCGDGYLSYLLAKSGLQVTAVDLSQNRLMKFQKVAQKFGIRQIQTDITQTGLPDESFDLVVCSEVLEHILAYEKVLKEAHRLLRRQGHLIVTVPYKETLKVIICPHCLKPFYQDGHLHRFDRKNLAQKLQESGFEVLKQKTFRSRGVVHIQHHLRIRYGLFLKTLDAVFSKVLPEWTFYLLIQAVKNVG